jgi:hypothetical protein
MQGRFFLSCVIQFVLFVQKELVLFVQLRVLFRFFLQQLGILRHLAVRVARLLLRPHDAGSVPEIRRQVRGAGGSCGVHRSGEAPGAGGRYARELVLHDGETGAAIRSSHGVRDEVHGVAMKGVGFSVETGEAKDYKENEENKDYKDS